MSTLQALSLREKIRQRGYWQVIIRPAKFEKDRIRNVQELLPLVEKNAVWLRGWDFPHIDRQSPPMFGQDWVEQESEWNHLLESWRFYQSGQFFDVCGFDHDWRDQSSIWPPEQGWQHGKVLYFRGALVQLTGIFEFAARLAQSSAGDDYMHVEVRAAHLAARKIEYDVSSGGVLMSRPPEKSMPEFSLIRDLSRIQLMTDARKLAVAATSDLMKQFGLQISARTISSLQEDIFRSIY